MNSRPLSTTLLTALALWALWLWERHRLLGVSPTPGDLPGGSLEGVPPLNTLPPPPLPGTPGGPNITPFPPGHVPVLPGTPWNLGGPVTNV